MDRTDCEIHILAINEPSEDYRKELDAENVTVHVINRRGGVAKYVWQLFWLMCKERFDVIHVHGNSAGMAIELSLAWLTGVHIRIAHGHSTKTEHERMHKLLYPIFKLFCNRPLACGQKAGEFLYRGRPFIELKNGIDLQQYSYDPEKRQAMREKLGLSDRFVIGHVGIFEDMKNHPFLLDTFAKLHQIDPRYTLVLIGGGTYFAEMQQKARTLRIEQSVIFVGKTTQVPLYMQAMDVLTLPSLYEGLPMVLIEAQAAGLPCLASDRVSKQADLTGNIQFLPISDENIWVDAIQNINVTSHRMERCEAAQQKLRQAGYDIQKSAEELCRIYFGKK